MPTVKVVLTKSMLWRGQEEEWSNGYYLSVATKPADRAARSALIDAVWAVEQKLLWPSNIFVSALYYDDPTVAKPVSDESFTYPKRGIAGARAGSNAAWTGQTTTNSHPELCLLVKANAGRTSKGRPRYLTKYYHPIQVPAGDAVNASLITNVNTAVTPLIDGTLPGAARWCSPGGIVATGIGLDGYLRVHQLKRRGKRPTTA